MNKIKINKFWFLSVLLIPFVATVWNGVFHYDPHHWGLMLSNAKDLFDNKTPYQYIFIQYGIITTLVQTLGFFLFGQNLISIILTTAIFYTLGLWAIYLISIHLTKNNKISLYILITCILIHPFAIYPWANYIAFPFLLFGIYSCINQKNNYSLVLAGFFFGLSVLAREGLAPPIFLFCFASSFLDWKYTKINIKAASIGLSRLFIGIFIPISIFLIYLYASHIYFYWYKLSWELPQIYAETMFKHVSSIQIFNPLVLTFYHGVISLNTRWILILLLVISNILYLIISVFKPRNRIFSVSYLKISIATLLLLSSSIHSPEVFRIATGSVVGITTLYFLIQNTKYSTPFFIVTSSLILMSIIESGFGSYFNPSRNDISELVYVKSPLPFRGQRWQKDVAQYYSNIEQDLLDVQKMNCGIKYHYNYTNDAQLQVISPFNQYQTAPFGVNDKMGALRPDLDYQTKISLTHDIVIMQIVFNKYRDTFLPPNKYYIFKKYSVPAAPFGPSESTLLLMIPKFCVPIKDYLSNNK